MSADAPAVAILCGGAGTRLRAVSGDTPKPLVEVAGRPFLEWLLEDLAAQGVTRVHLLCGYRADVFEAFRAARGAVPEVVICVEQEPRGTAGAVREAAGVLFGCAHRRDADSRLVLLNGDSSCGVDLAELRDAHRRAVAGDPLVLATMAVAPAPDASADYGSVEVAGERVVAFAEKVRAPAPGEAETAAPLASRAGDARGCGINAGVYALERTLVDGWPAGRALSLEREVLPELAARGRLASCPVPGPVVDIGTPERIARARAHFGGRRRP